MLGARSSSSRPGRRDPRITRRRRPSGCSRVGIACSRSSSAREGICCVCARKVCTSLVVSSRHSPGPRSPKVIGPSRTRIRRRTSYPSSRATSRICRLRPSRITMRTHAPSSVRSKTSTQAGIVSPSSSSTPSRQRRRSSMAGGRSRSTRYSFSTSKRGWVSR